MDAPIHIFNTDNKEPVQYDDDLDLKKIRAKTIEMCENDDVPLVSIIIQAYNKLEECTKTALDFIKKYTSDIDAELLLIDNGSTDGTFEYFKEFDFPRKRIIHVTKNLGSVSGGVAANIFANHTTLGKYVVLLTNSIFVTKNWLSNLITCMESDIAIGMAVAVSNSKENYQGVDLNFNDLDDMEKKAAEFNVSDSSRWEERIHLVTNSVTIFRREVWYQIKGDLGFVHNFGDDDLSFQIRRLGYKLIVCRDTFVYRIPHLTTGMDSKTYNEDIKKGSEMFKEKYYGIDSWDDGFNHEWDLCKHIVAVSIVENENIKHYVLGIDVRCGMPILQLKNNFRGVKHNDVTLSSYFENAKYWLDLKTVCAGDVVCGDIDRLPEKMKDKFFTEIIIGKYMDEYDDPKNLLENAMERLAPTGCLGIKFRTYPKRTNSIDDSINLVLKDVKFEWYDDFVGFIVKHKNWAIKSTKRIYNEEVSDVANSLSIPSFSEKRLQEFKNKFIDINSDHIMFLCRQGV